MVSCVQSGRAIQHVKENIFTADGGVRRGIPNVLVVLTDGRSQDDVNKVSKEMQMEGQVFICFIHEFGNCLQIFISPESVFPVLSICIWHQQLKTQQDTVVFAWLTVLSVRSCKRLHRVCHRFC